MARVITRWARLCIFGAALAFALMEAAGGYWPMVLLTPYTPQCAVIGLFGTVLLALFVIRKPTRADVAFVFAGLLAAGYGGAMTFGLIPWRTIAAAQHVTPADADFGRVKVFSANVHTENTDHKTVLEVIAEENPDIILLPEVSDAWAAELRELNERYPNHTVMPDSLGNFGIAFWSRLPGVATWSIMKDADPFAEYDVPQMDATLTLTDSAGRPHAIRFIGLHPLPPIRPGNTHARDAVLLRTGESVAARKGVPTIVAGDFNATRYCNIARRMTVHSGLRDAASPLRFSWPNVWSWWAMGIRIDHTLATDAWHVIDTHTGRDIHSDHLPIVTTLQLVNAGG